MSEKLAPLVKGFEQCRLRAYLCPAGRWTIGWGHTSEAGAPAVADGMVITQARADEIFAADLAAFRARVAALCAKAKGGAAEEEVDAFTSLAYNIGIPAFAGSTALRKYSRGDKQGAADAILAWNQATVKGKRVVLAGLVRRRQAERALFLDGHAAATAAAVGQDFGDMPQAVERPQLRKPIYRSTTAHAASGMGAGGALFAYEGAKQSVAFMSDAKAQASQAATLFGVPEGSAVMVGGGVLIVVGAGFVVWKRYRRSVEDVVVKLAAELHIPYVADLLGYEEVQVEQEATHVEATVETEAGTVAATVDHVETTVTSVATPAVEAVEDVAGPVVEAVQPVADKVEAVAAEAVQAAVADVAAAADPHESEPAARAADPAPTPAPAPTTGPRIPTLRTVGGAA